MWALNKNPVDRPANADQFITALEQAKAAILSGDARRAHGEHAGAGRRRRRPVRRRSAALTAPPAAPPPARGDTLGGVVVGAVPRGRAPARASPRSGRGAARSLALLLLAGGGVAAYLLTRPAKVVVPAVTGEQFNDRAARSSRTTTSTSAR